MLWSAVAGKEYVVEYNDDLGSVDWVGLPGVVTATGSMASALDRDASGVGLRFYRVRVVE